MKKKPISILLLLAWLLAGGAHADPVDFSAIDTLPPGEQYRQLSLVLMISVGADPKLVERLMPDSAEAALKEGAAIDPEAFTTPLTRIVDQKTMLNGAATVLRFANGAQKQIHDKLAAIKKANPVLIDMLDANAISEDAIIIRNAIADSISYAGLAKSGKMAEYLKTYRTRTLRLRNEMEFANFSKELDRITAESIRAVSGQSDAYQRMFDDEVVAKGFKRQIEAADYIYKRDKDFDKHAAKMTEEIIKNVVAAQQSQVSH